MNDIGPILRAAALIGLVVTVMAGVGTLVLGVVIGAML